MGFYLGWLDLALLSVVRDKHCVCVWHTNDAAEPLRLRSLASYLSNSVNLPVEDMDVNPSYNDKNTWFFVSCRADFEGGPVHSANHFVPAWHRDQIGGDMFALTMASVMKEITDRKALIAEELVRLMAECNDDEEDEDSENESGNDAYTDSLLDDDKILSNQLEFVRLVAAKGLVPEFVPADGNCGLWSMLSLERGSPQAVDAGKKLQMDDVGKLRHDSRILFNELLSVLFHMFSALLYLESWTTTK